MCDHAAAFIAPYLRVCLVMFQCAIMTSPIGTMDTHEIIQIANTYATNNGIYHYSKMLGKGSFGVVLKAQDQIQVRMVAIKIILAEKSLIQFLLGGTPAAAEAGQEEANMLTNLKHVNVIAIRDHFKFEVTRKWAAGFAIVMDYCSSHI